MKRFIRLHTDDEIINAESPHELVLDCLPGNYIPTPEQAAEIADEIVRCVARHILGDHLEAPRSSEKADLPQG